jgi:hypothetical protein
MEAQPLEEKWIFTTRQCNYFLVACITCKNPLVALNKLHASLVANNKWNENQHIQFHSYLKCMIYAIAMELTYANSCIETFVCN